MKRWAKVAGGGLVAIGMLLMWLIPAAPDPFPRRPSAHASTHPVEEIRVPVPRLQSLDPVRQAIALGTANAMATSGASLALPAAHARFTAWAERFLESTAMASPESIANGRRLALERRELLAREIRSNPRAALEHAVPWEWRGRLPDEITALFEEPVSGRGRLEVYWATPLPGGGEDEFVGGKVRYVTLGDRVWRAFVYGRRVAQMGREEISVHGIAIGTDLALHEAPVRLLAEGEARALLAAGSPDAPRRCGLCGQPVADGHVWAQFGDRILRLCSRAHLGELNRSLMAAEADLSRGEIGSTPAPGNPSGSQGTKRVLFLRVVFRDDILEPISESEAVELMKQVNDFYVEASYGKTALLTTVAPLLTLPFPKLHYTANGPGAVLEDARAAAEAAGFPPGEYQLLLIRHPNVPGFTWGGLGGGGVAWLQGNSVGLVVHEIGHNYGLGHANYWDTRRDVLPPNPNNYPFDTASLVGRDSVIGVGDDLEYGDIFDVMGSGGGEGIDPGGTNQVIARLAGQFNAIAKHQLGWLPEASLARADDGGRFRIFAFDTPHLSDGRHYALTVTKDAYRTYWVSARGRLTDNPWLQHGVSLHWGGWEQGIGYSSLLDTTPGSQPGREDSAILVGRTYADGESEVHITPVERGGEGTETWYDLVVHRGPFPLNRPPVAQVEADPLEVGIGQPVTLRALASDADGDELAYFWDFGEPWFAPNAAEVTRTWTTPGDHVVRCEVSDLKGGVISRHLVVRVGGVQGYRIAGRVLDDDGEPVSGAWVSNGRLAGAAYAYADDYQWTYTDSDGRYTLVNLAAGAYPVTAYLAGHTVRPVSFVEAITLVDQDAGGVDFLASRLPVVTVETAADADPALGREGAFRLARTGETNTALRAVFWLGGTAAEDADYAGYTNEVAQTNVVPTPFGPVEGVYTFKYIDFPTGVMETNLTIVPTATQPPPEPLSVVLTLMHALQVERITMLTNTNIVSFTGWETRQLDRGTTWFQTDSDYHLRQPSEATVEVLGELPLRPVISVLALDTQASENGHDVAQFTLVRSGRKDVSVDVRFEVRGDAEEGSDYEPLPRTVRFDAQQTHVNLVVVAREDRFLEGNESVEIVLEPGPDFDIGAASASILIIDNDLPLVTVVAADGVATEQPGDTGRFTFSRVGDLTRDLEVRYLMSGSAINGLDYRALSGSVRIPAGQPTASLLLEPRDNLELDGGKSAELHLADSPVYNIGWPARATVRILDRALPTISLRVDDGSAAESGDTGLFSLVRSGSTTERLRVRLAVGGTAQRLADYVDIPEEIRFNAGVTVVPLTVTPVNDRFREDPETVILQVLEGEGYNVGTDWQGQVTLSDDDSGALPAIGFNFLRSAGGEAAGVAQVAVSVSANPAEDTDVTVDFAVPGGTALPDVDYEALSSTGRIVFPHNPNGGKDELTNRTQLISVPLFDNSEFQPDRSMLFALLEPAATITNEIVTNEITITNALGEVETTNEIATNIVVIPVPMNAFFDVYDTHTFTILDDDADEVWLRVVEDTAWEEGTRPAVIELQRGGATNRSQSVELYFSGLAANGVDFQPLAQTVLIPAGVSAVQLPVVPIDDPMQEFLEDARVTIMNAPGARVGSPASVTVSIVDNDGTVEFTRTLFRAGEGQGEALVSVRRTGETNTARQVAWFIHPGTAIEGEDYLATNGVLRFVAGQQTAEFRVPLVDDRTVEVEENANLTLRNVGDGTPLGGQSFAELRITDDDSLFQFLTNRWTAPENGGTALISVVRTGVLTNQAVVTVISSNAVAMAGEDYVAVEETLLFAPEQSVATFAVAVLDDIAFEGDEAFGLTLAAVEGGSVAEGMAEAVVEILDDECAVEFAAAETVADEYAREVHVTVVRRGGLVNAVEVQFKTADETAEAGKDYLATQGTVSFAGQEFGIVAGGEVPVVLAPGESNQVLRLRLLDDRAGEGHETFHVALAEPRGSEGAIPAGSVVLGSLTNATVRILDNEMPGGIDFEFNPGRGVDGPVLALAVQPDGKILLGGDFHRVDGIQLNNVARLHADGYLDTFLSPGEGTDGPVHAITVQPDGRILLGGDFTQFRAQPAPRLIRLNADGAIDPDFQPGEGPDGLVRVIRVADNGTLVLGGDFTRVRGVRRAYLARLESDGSLVPSFDAELGGPVRAMEIQPDGKLIVAGDFTAVNGVAQPRITRLLADGTRDPAFEVGEGADGPVHALALQSDGRVLLGGGFAQVRGQVRPGLARLRADGSLDEAFAPPGGADATVLALGLQPDGKILVGGAFTHFNARPRARYARLNPTGTVDLDFDIGRGANDTVRAMALQPDTALVIGGDFTLVNDLPRARVARIHGDDQFRPNTVQFALGATRVPESIGMAQILVLRSGDLSTPLAVDCFTRAGSATPGEDYLEAETTLWFDVDQSETYFAVSVLEDATAEGDETVELVLTNLPPGFLTVGRLQAALIIEDNEGAVGFASARTEVSESDGVAQVAVRRTGPLAEAASVAYETLPGTALAEADYVRQSGVLELSPGVSELFIEVALLNDDEAELEEAFGLRLFDPSGPVALGSQREATVVIHDDDQVEAYSLNVLPVLGGSVTPPSGAYPSGSLQELTGRPERGYVFLEWRGTTNSSVNPLPLLMDRNHTIEARFEAAWFSYTFEPPFGTDRLTRPPWASPAAKPWRLTTATAAGGSQSARSGLISDGEETRLELAVHSDGGAGSFMVRVSSEANWDYLEFYVNGRRFHRWSGDVPWQSFKFPLPAGDHVLGWRYVKDANFSSGLDAAFLDNLFLPGAEPPVDDVAPRLAVRDFDGAILRMQVTGRPGAECVIEVSRDLAAWEPFAATVLGAAPYSFEDVLLPGEPARFYRASSR